MAMANATCAVATAISHEIALPSVGQMARQPALTSVSVAMGKAIGEQTARQQTLT